MITPAQRELLTPTELMAVTQRVLTPRQYDVWVLHHAGMSQRSIALHLDLDRGTVRHHITASLRRLRKAGAIE